MKEGQRFRGGLDQKMRRMWLGREVVVAGLPPLAQHILTFPKTKKWELGKASDIRTGFNSHQLVTWRDLDLDSKPGTIQD